MRVFCCGALKFPLSETADLLWFCIYSLHMVVLPNEYLKASFRYFSFYESLKMDISMVETGTVVR